MKLLKKINFLKILCTLKSLGIGVFAIKAPGPWCFPHVEKEIYENVLYLPVADDSVRAVPIKESGEKLFDLNEEMIQE